MSPTLERLVLHWGEMGTRWGINRTVAQTHALLYFSPNPLAIDEIASALGVARSHVSNSLKELQAWGVVKVVHRLGDRRDHFQSLQDVWEMFELLLDQRKQREVDPTFRLLREVAGELGTASGDPTEAHTRQRLMDLLGFFEVMDTWYAEVKRLPRVSRVRLVKLGSRLSEWLR